MLKFNNTLILSLLASLPMLATAQTNPAMTPIISYLLDSKSIPTIVSSTTGKTWMDRNLGASEVCTKSRGEFSSDRAYTYSQKNCFGSYYQWGRNTDGHEKRNSRVTSQQATDISNVGHSEFIKSYPGYNEDWAYNIDENGRRRMAYWNPCPTGFRIPSSVEASREKNRMNNRQEAFDVLKLPTSGHRCYANGTLKYEGKNGSFWSSQIKDTRSKAVWFTENYSGFRAEYRTYGRPIRCIKE